MCRGYKSLIKSWEGTHVLEQGGEAAAAAAAGALLPPCSGTGGSGCGQSYNLRTQL